MLAEFERQRAAAPKPTCAGASADSCALVVGFAHTMHMLWNHLPALQGASAAGAIGELPIMMTYAPFGPTEEILPDLAPQLTPLAFPALAEFNAAVAMPLGIGSRTIPRGLRDRIREVAKRHAAPSALSEPERFRAARRPIFWFTVKPFERTAHNQAEVLAAIVAEIARQYPDAGFLLDGVSLPWDFAGNPNYDGFFRDWFDRQLRGTELALSELIGRIDQSLHHAVVPLNDISACDEIVWAAIADFYFCHGGTAHHKIGWLHETPGMMYANRQFIAHYRALEPLEDHPPIWYLPARLVAEDPDTACTPEQLARNAQNFTLLAPAEIARALLGAFREAVAAQIRTAHEGSFQVDP